MRYFLVFALIFFAQAARAEPANTMKEMFAQLQQCLAPIRIAPGTDVTVLFSLNRRGGLIGKPRLTYAHWTGDPASRKASADSISDNFNHCLPASITDGLGGAIAGRPLTYRLSGAGEEAL